MEMVLFLGLFFAFFYLAALRFDMNKAAVLNTRDEKNGQPRPPAVVYLFTDRNFTSFSLSNRLPTKNSPNSP